MKLSERERRFVEHYMGAAAGNATQAARHAGNPAFRPCHHDGELRRVD